jgi:hypothetical protein
VATPIITSDETVLRSWERDGFTLMAHRLPDHDSRPGENDVTVTLVPVDPTRHERARIYPGVVQGEYLAIADDEIERLAKAWDQPIGTVAE